MHGRVSQPGIKEGYLCALASLSEHVIVVDRVVMADVTKFDMVGTQEFENDPIGLIDAKAPDFVMFWTEFLAVE